MIIIKTIHTHTHTNPKFPVVKVVHVKTYKCLKIIHIYSLCNTILARGTELWCPAVVVPGMSGGEFKTGSRCASVDADIERMRSQPIRENHVTRQPMAAQQAACFDLILSWREP